MKKQHLNAIPLFSHLLQHESQCLLALTVRALGLHRLTLSMELVSETLGEAALQPFFHWPSDLPTFLLERARKKVFDTIRQQALVGHLAKEVDLEVEAGTGLEAVLQKIFSQQEVEKSRLGLLFACSHPALPLALRQALVLRSSYTFAEKDIDHLRHTADLSLFKLLETAPEVLLHNGVQPGIPSSRHFQPRFDALLETLWAIFSEGFEQSEKTLFARRAMCDQAFRSTAFLLDNEKTRLPATYSLMSVESFLAARFDPRRGRVTSFLFLDEKNRSKWNPALIDKGVEFYEAGGAQGSVGEFGLLAQLLMEHSLAPNPRFTNWGRLLQLSEALTRVKPVFQYHLYFAWAMAKNRQPYSGIQHLFSVPGFSEHLLEDWQTNAVLGELYRQCRFTVESIRYFRHARLKAPSPALQRMLFRKIVSLERGKSKSKKKKKRW